MKTPLQEPVRWGVLGASHFALMATLPAMQKALLVSVRALAAKDSSEVAELLTTDPMNQYTRQAQAVSEAIRSGRPVRNDM